MNYNLRFVILNQIIYALTGLPYRFHIRNYMFHFLNVTPWMCENLHSSWLICYSYYAAFKIFLFLFFCKFMSYYLPTIINEQSIFLSCQNEVLLWKEAYRLIKHWPFYEMLVITESFSHMKVLNKWMSSYTFVFRILLV